MPRRQHRKHVSVFVFSEVEKGNRLFWKTSLGVNRDKVAWLCLDDFFFSMTAGFAMPRLCVLGSAVAMRLKITLSVLKGCITVKTSNCVTKFPISSIISVYV